MIFSRNLCISYTDDEQRTTTAVSPGDVHRRPDNYANGFFLAVNKTAIKDRTDAHKQVIFTTTFFP